MLSFDFTPNEFQTLLLAIDTAAEEKRALAGLLQDNAAARGLPCGTVFGFSTESTLVLFHGNTFCSVEIRIRGYTNSTFYLWRLSRAQLTSIWAVNINRYILRTDDLDLVSGKNTVFVYSKLFIIFDFMAR